MKCGSNFTENSCGCYSWPFPALSHNCLSFSHVSDDLHYRFIAASETEQGKKVNCKVTSGVHDKHVKRTAGLKDVWKYLYIFCDKIERQT